MCHVQCTSCLGGRNTYYQGRERAATNIDDKSSGGKSSGAGGAILPSGPHAHAEGYSVVLHLDGAGEVKFFVKSYARHPCEAL